MVQEKTALPWRSKAFIWFCMRSRLLRFGRVPPYSTGKPVSADTSGFRQVISGEWRVKSRPAVLRRGSFRVQQACSRKVEGPGNMQARCDLVALFERRRRDQQNAKPIDPITLHSPLFTLHSVNALSSVPPGTGIPSLWSEWTTPRIGPPCRVRRCSCRRRSG